LLIWEETMKILAQLLLDKSKIKTKGVV